MKRPALARPAMRVRGREFFTSALETPRTLF